MVKAYLYYGFSYLVSLWLITKWFKTNSAQIRNIILTITLLFADLIFFFMFLNTSIHYNPAFEARINQTIFISLLIITIITSTSILLHATKNTEYEVAVLKALGGQKITIYTSLFAELLIIVAIGSLAGGFIGLSLFSGYSLLANSKIQIVNLAVIYFIPVFIILNIIISSSISVIFAWRRSNKPIIEGIIHAK